MPRPTENGEMKRRHPFLLLEMMIALVIMTTTVALLFMGFYDAIKAQNSIKKNRANMIHFQRLKLRFAILFKDIIDVKKIPNEGYYIRYQGGVESDHRFRSETEAVLRTKNNILTLTCWPKEGDPRQEVLSTDVNKFTLEFFNEKEGSFLEEYPDKKPFMMKVFISSMEVPLFL